MVKHIADQLAAAGAQKRPATAPKAAAAAVVPPGGREGQQAPVLAPLAWEVAGGLHAEQHGDYFRVVVRGPKQQLPALLAHLNLLK